MYQIGEYIVYANSGVCRVAAVGTPSFSHVEKGRLYYTLAPVYGTETIYVPVDTTAYMRPIMTREEAERLIEGIPAIQEDTAEIKSMQLRSEHYQASFHSHDCYELVQLIKTIYRKDANAQRAGRRPSTVDRQYKKRAEDLLHGELAVVLGIPREGVPAYIRDKIAKKPHKPPLGGYGAAGQAIS